MTNPPLPHSAKSPLTQEVEEEVFRLFDDAIEGERVLKELARLDRTPGAHMDAAFHAYAECALRDLKAKLEKNKAILKSTPLTQDSMKWEVEWAIDLLERMSESIKSPALISVADIIRRLAKHRETQP